jgi:hypothetical protein
MPRILILMLFLLALLFGCCRLPVDVIPDPHATFRELTVKFTFHAAKERQNGRIIIKLDDERVKMLFVSPLNRVYFELSAEREQVLLFNLPGKTVWHGDFHTLIGSLWGLDLNLDALMRLLLTGQKPPVTSGQTVDVNLDRSTSRPHSIVCKQAERALELVVQAHETKPGQLIFRSADGFEPVDLDTVLET